MSQVWTSVTIQPLGEQHPLDFDGIQQLLEEAVPALTDYPDSPLDLLPGDGGPYANVATWSTFSLDMEHKQWPVLSSALGAGYILTVEEEWEGEGNGRESWEYIDGVEQVAKGTTDRDVLRVLPEAIAAAWALLDSDLPADEAWPAAATALQDLLDGVLARRPDELQMPAAA